MNEFENQMRPEYRVRVTGMTICSAKISTNTYMYEGETSKIRAHSTHGIDDKCIKGEGATSEI
jgi:hypothetical protein